MVLTIAAMLMMPTGTADAFLGKKKKETPLQRAERYYNDREYYLARQTTLEILAEDPSDMEAQRLMGKILDAEIERQKEQVFPLAAEEMNRDERSAQAKTWIERSKALLERGEYDLALFAAEKVFIYESDNSQASDVIDQIKERAIKEGKADMLFLNKIYEEEISDRLDRYRGEAQDFARQGHYGQARFSVEKILLLEPEDPQALKIHQSILQQEKASRYEA
ncbi:MAG: hypothetical protein BWY42_00656 [Candidatus Omnitrophica bacterium ADurb.Bin277]|nr:MAG: hypothetical protein BWY42_00656 [Candidatus Omnitrophica bacterium ADurb.Bin277]